MSRDSDDERAVRELSRMARVYSQRGMVSKADEIMVLIEAIRQRLRQENLNNSSAGDQNSA
jgi:hypothetical protein